MYGDREAQVTCTRRTPTTGCTAKTCSWASDPPSAATPSQLRKSWLSLPSGIPQFFHIDEERANSEGHFGGLIASGVHTLAVYQRLSIQSRTQHWHVIGGAGIRDLQFRRPVRPSDTLTGVSVVENVRLAPGRARALVEYSGELTNQDGERTPVLTMAAYLQMRPA